MADANSTTIPELITRAEAGVAGLKRYFTGKPCRRGHVGGRLVSDGNCVECARLKVLEWRRANPDRLAQIAKTARDRRLENPELAREKQRDYYRSHAERRKELSRRYHKAHPEWNRAYCHKNREHIRDLRIARYHADVEHSRQKQRAMRKELYERFVAKCEAEIGRKRPEICEACGVRPRGRVLHWDHDHETGKGRGWLCSNCNMALGLVHDRVGILVGLVDYIGRYMALDKP